MFATSETTSIAETISRAHKRIVTILPILSLGIVIF
jgi:hypothetical protein